MSRRDKLYEELTLKIVQNTMKKGACVLKVSLASVCVTTDHVTYLNNNMSTTAIFLDIEHAFHIA